MLFEIIYCDGEMTNDYKETQGGQIHIAPVLLLVAGLKFAQKSSTGKGRHCVYFGQVRSLLCACILTQVEEDNLANVSTSLSGSHIEDLTKTRVSNSKCFSKRFTPNRHN